MPVPLSDKLFLYVLQDYPAKDSILSATVIQTAATATDHPRPLAQQELSDYFGVSRPSLARELSHMQEDGMIIADRKQITILQKEWLIRLIQ